MGWISAVWIPTALGALVVAFKAASVSRIVEDMGPGLGSGTVASALPWWLLGALIAAASLVVIALVSVAFQARPWASLLGSAVVAAAVLGVTYYSLVVAPIASVLAEAL